MKLPHRPDIEIRDVEPGDRDAVVDLLERGRAHISGSRRRPVFRALVADTAGGDRRRVAGSMAVLDGRPVAVILAIAGDAPRYWRSLLWRHPVAFACLAGHRLKRLPARVSRRRTAKAVDPDGAAAHTRIHPALADEPRLQVPPPGPDEPGPHAGETGPHIALGLFLVVDPSMRGQRISEPVFRRVLFQLRELGLDRYDCSFRPADVAAAKMHLSMPFVVYRFPAGYHGSIDLHHPDLDWPPST